MSSAVLAGLCARLAQIDPKLAGIARLSPSRDLFLRGSLGSAHKHLILFARMLPQFARIRPPDRP